jgi:hypothetical protein
MNFHAKRVGFTLGSSRIPESKTRYHAKLNEAALVA